MPDYRHSELQAAIAGIVVSQDSPFVIVVSPTGSGKTWIQGLVAKGVEIVGPIEAGLPTVGLPQGRGVSDYLMLVASAAGVVLIGVIPAFNFDLLEAFACGYKQGAKSVNPSVEVLETYVGAGFEAFNDPVKATEVAKSQLDQGVDVIYQQIKTAVPNGTSGFAGVALTQPAGSGKVSGTYFTDDLGVWSGSFRVQRNFLP